MPYSQFYTQIAHDLISGRLVAYCVRLRTSATSLETHDVDFCTVWHRL